MGAEIQFGETFMLFFLTHRNV